MARACAGCGKPVPPMRRQGNRRKWCSESCRVRASRYGSLEVPALASDPCAYCGEPASELDHIQPTSRGGEWGWTNLTAACRRCNAQKKDADLLRYLLARPLLAQAEDIKAQLATLKAA